MHGGPDVIEELNLDDRLETAGRHAEGAADDVGFGQRRVEDAVGAELALQAGGEFEDAALAFDLLVFQILLAGAVGDIFAEDDDALVAPHFVVQAGVDEVGHGAVAALGDADADWKPWRWASGPPNRRGERSCGLREGRVERGSAAACTSASTSRCELLQGGRSRMPSAAETSAGADGIAQGVCFALALGTVELLVVGERVRVGADDMAVHKGRAVAGADVLDGAAHGGKASAGRCRRTPQSGSWGSWPPAG